MVGQGWMLFDVYSSFIQNKWWPWLVETIYMSQIYVSLCPVLIVCVENALSMIWLGKDT